MQFPKLADTQFPDLQTVNVYQFQNTFDYTRWNEKSKIKLCNVLWNSDYADVVKFDNDESRDNWFDGIDDYYPIELLTAARVVPEGYIKLPVPYDVMARYNYLFIDIPIATNTNTPLDYETSEGKRRWYFFVTNISYLSPNATQVYLQLDVWTNFQNEVDIHYLLLERGHAPVAYSDTDDYLDNPLENNKYLLAPDVNFDNASIVRESKMIPFGTGKKYVCIASTCGASQISDLGLVTSNSEYDPSSVITFDDIDNLRYGYQLEVNGLHFGNGRDYSNARTPASMGASNDNRIANNLSVYAIAASECYGNGAFFKDVIEKCPQFLLTVKGCFVVSEECITLGTTYTIAGHTVRACIGKDSTLLSNLKFTKADFAYPTIYEQYAKLYTSPYSILELTDNDGNTYEIGVEETSTISAKSFVSIAYPFINERIYFTGIRGKNTTAPSYYWKDLADSQHSINIPDSDWFQFCFDWKIPTFALYMDGETAYQLESFNRNVKNAIRQALVSYHTTVRSANTDYENAFSQASVAYSNAFASASTNKQNALNSANTAKTNAENSADTGKTNANNSADTNETNSINSANTAKTNADASADTAYNNVDRTCTALTANNDLANILLTNIESYAIARGTAIKNYQNSNLGANAQSAIDATIGSTAASVTNATQSNIATNLGTVFTSGLSGAASGAFAGGPVGAAIGGAIGLVGGTVSAATASNTVTIGNAMDATTASFQNQCTAEMAQNAADLNDNVQIELNGQKQYNYTWRVSTSESQQINSNAASRANADATRNTAKANATRSKDTAITNAGNTRNTADTNADNTYDTAITNAGNTYNTSTTNATNTYNTEISNALATRDNVQDNAEYTREVAVINAQEILRNAKNTAMARINDARNTKPIAVCDYSGNPEPDYYMTRGVQIKIKTQNESAIRQAGDIFARYGYALNQVWDVESTGLKLMKHFTYWKAAEIWVDNKNSNNFVQTFIQNMFLKGVTIWNSPIEIGKINVYNN